MNCDNLNSGKCALCINKGIILCRGCSKTIYCSEEHQNKHWKNHKVECRPFTIVDNKLVATRDIPQNKLIFTEVPIVISPKMNPDNKSSSVNCVGCFDSVSIGGYTCPKCAWPVCTPDCQGLINQKLHALECPILSIGRAPPTFRDQTDYLNHYRYDALMPLKCLVLQKSNPKKWQSLMSMESFESKRKDKKIYRDEEERIVSYLENNYLKRIKLTEEKTSKSLLSECDTKILHKLCGIIETNSLNIELDGDRELNGLYAQASRLEHSCLPNCFYTFDNTSGFRLCVRAARDIKTGEDLSIMYTHILWGTQMRLEHLRSIKYKVCVCKRCTDPTELGTYLSALKCFGSEEIGTCDGIQLPVKPLSRSTEWSCTKCPIKITSEQVQYLMSQMSDEVEAVKANITDLESLITKLSQFLHPNHYHLFALKHSLIQIQGHQKNSTQNILTDTQLQDKIEMCESLLKICDTLDPNSIRLSIYKSIILYELQQTIIELNKRRLKSMKDNDVKQFIEENFKRASTYLKRSKDVLEFEISTKHGKSLIQNIDEATRNLNNFCVSNNINI